MISFLTMECINKEAIKKISHLLTLYLEGEKEGLFCFLCLVLVTFQLPFLSFSVFSCFPSIKGSCKCAHTAYVFVHPRVLMSSECCHDCLCSPVTAGSCPIELSS